MFSPFLLLNPALCFARKEMLYIYHIRLSYRLCMRTSKTGMQAVWVNVAEHRKLQADTQRGTETQTWSHTMETGERLYT